jgi:hypothetical protein
VNEPAESNESSPNASALASPCTTRTFVSAKRWRSAPGGGGVDLHGDQIGDAVPQPVGGRPRPGPISSIRVPRSIPAHRPGSTSVCMWAAHSGLGQTLA